jgi:hypothetical protein
MRSHMVRPLPDVLSLALARDPLEGKECESIMRPMCPPAVSGGEPDARAVRRPTARSGHVVARHLEARIVA